MSPPSGPEAAGARILVVEDEPSWSRLVRDILKKRGYQVAIAEDADEALQQAKLVTPHLVILDLNLKGISGLKVCELLRAEPVTAAVPILMLTVLKSEQDTVRGLQLGADDYLPKPFGHEELAARVMALLRRARHTVGFDRELHAKGLIVNLDRHEVIAGGKPVDLRPKEFNLLVALMQKAGRVVAKEALVRTVWNEEAIVSDATLTQHIKNLRAKLGPAADLLETIETVGYKFRA